MELLIKKYSLQTIVVLAKNIIGPIYWYQLDWRQQYIQKQKRKRRLLYYGSKIHRQQQQQHYDNQKLLQVPRKKNNNSNNNITPKHNHHHDPVLRIVEIDGNDDEEEEDTTSTNILSVATAPPIMIHQPKQHYYHHHHHCIPIEVGFHNNNNNNNNSDSTYNNNIERSCSPLSFLLDTTTTSLSFYNYLSNTMTIEDDNDESDNNNDEEVSDKYNDNDVYDFNNNNNNRHEKMTMNNRNGDIDSGSSSNSSSSSSSSIKKTILVNSGRFVIPEALPAAMIRYANSISIIDMSTTTTSSSSSTTTTSYDDPDNNNNNNNNNNNMNTINKTATTTYANNGSFSTDIQLTDDDNNNEKEEDTIDDNNNCSFTRTKTKTSPNNYIIGDIIKLQISLVRALCCPDDFTTDDEVDKHENQDSEVEEEEEKIKNQEKTKYSTSASTTNVDSSFAAVAAVADVYLNRPSHHYYCNIPGIQELLDSLILSWVHTVSMLLRSRMNDEHATAPISNIDIIRSNNHPDDEYFGLINNVAYICSDVFRIGYLPYANVVYMNLIHSFLSIMEEHMKISIDYLNKIVLEQNQSNVKMDSLLLFSLEKSFVSYCTTCSDALSVITTVLTSYRPDIIREEKSILRQVTARFCQLHVETKDRLSQIKEQVENYPFPSEIKLDKSDQSINNKDLRLPKNKSIEESIRTIDIYLTDIVDLLCNLSVSFNSNHDGYDDNNTEKMPHALCGREVINELLHLLIRIVSGIQEEATNSTSHNHAATEKKTEIGMAELALRILVSMLWGVRSDNGDCTYRTRISSLRIHLKDVLNSIAKILSSPVHYSIIRNIVQNFDDGGGGHERQQEQKLSRKSSFSDSDGDRVLASFCSLAEASLNSLKGLLENEILCGDGGSLSCIEWDALEVCLETVVSKWLLIDNKQIPINISCSRLRVIKNALLMAQTLIGTVMPKFLKKAIELDTIQFTEYCTIKKLSLCLLRDAVPILSNYEESKWLSSNVIRCLGKYGFFPYQLAKEAWIETVSELLSEAFRRYDTDDENEECANFVQTAFTQQETLKVLLSNLDSSNAVTTNIIEPDGGCRGGDDVAGNSFFKLSLLPDFVIDNDCGLLELIISWIVPFLEEILLRCSLGSSVALVRNNDRIKSGMVYSGEFLSKDAVRGMRCIAPLPSSIHRSERIDLNLYVVHLIGRMFRCGVARNREKVQMVAILKSVVLDKFFHTDELGVNISSRKLSHMLPVRFAAIRELGVCLTDSFSKLSREHTNIPPLVEALRCIANTYDEQDSKEGYKTGIALSTWAIALLTGLRIVHDHRIVFQCRGRTFEGIQDVEDFFSRYASVDYKSFSFSIQRQQLTIPFLRSSTYPGVLSHRSSIIDFNPILDALGEALERIQNLNEGSRIVQGMRKIYFSVLQDLSYASVCPMASIISFKVISAHNLPVDDILIMLSTLSTLIQSTSALIEKRPVHSGLVQGRVDTTIMFDLFRTIYPNAYHTLSPIERILASRELSSLISSIKHCDDCNNETNHLDLLQSTLEALLLSELESKVLHQETKECPRDFTSCLPLFEIVYNFLIVAPKYEFSKNFIVLCCRLSIGVICQKYTKREMYFHQIAVRCLPRLIDRIDVTVAEELAQTDDLAYSGNGSLDFAKSIFLELLSRRAQFADLVKSANQESLTTEFDSIICSQQENVADENFVAWLYGRDRLLTCRFGTDRYRGWIELILRTPCSQDRRIVRIPNHLSLDNPKLPSMPSELPAIARSPNNYSAPEASPLMKKAAYDVSLLGTKLMGNKKNTKRLAKLFRSAIFRKNVVSVQVRPASPAEPSLPEAHPNVTDWLRSKCGVDMAAAHTVRNEIMNLLKICTPDMQRKKSGIESEVIFRLLPFGSNLERSIAMIDRTSLSSHKIGLLYDGPANNQSSSLTHQWLENSRCSPSFLRFSEGLGKIIPIPRMKYFSAGLDTSLFQTDGEYALWWSDHSLGDSIATAANCVVVFHMLSLMPDNHMNRKRHVGNDNVVIVYSENNILDPSESEQCDTIFSRSSPIGGTFGFVAIFVLPSQCQRFVRVSTRIRSELNSPIMEETLSVFVRDVIVPVNEGPAFVRNLGILADIACSTTMHDTTVEAPPCAYFERYQLLLQLNKYVA